MDSISSTRSTLCQWDHNGLWQRCEWDKGITAGFTNPEKTPPATWWLDYVWRQTSDYTELVFGERKCLKKKKKNPAVHRTTFVRLSTLELKKLKVLRATRTSSLSQMSCFFLVWKKNKKHHQYQTCYKYKSVFFFQNMNKNFNNTKKSFWGLSPPLVVGGGGALLIVFFRRARKKF